MIPHDFFSTNIKQYYTSFSALRQQGKKVIIKLGQSDRTVLNEFDGKEHKIDGFSDLSGLTVKGKPTVSMSKKS